MRRSNGKRAWVARSAAGLALVTALAAACVNGTEAPNVEGTPVGAPGSYSLSVDGIQASLTMIGTTGQLEIENGTTADVGPPGLTAVDEAGDRIQATVWNAAPVAAGDSALFQVTFPAGFRPTAYPTLELLLGGRDAGPLRRN